MTAGVGGAEMGQSKDGKADDLTSAFEAAENSENTTATEGNMSPPGTPFTHVATYIYAYDSRCPEK